MKSFRIIVETPPGVPDPTLAIAGSRAGGTGVLNLEFVPDIRTCIEHIEKLSRYVARNDFGVKVGMDSSLQVAEIADRLSKHFRMAVLSGIHNGNLKDRVGKLRALGIEVLIECISFQEAVSAEQAGADGVIAKGHESGGRIGAETTFILLQRFIQQLSLPVWAKGGIGVHTASACFAAGAAGIVLDSQVVLTRESTLPGEIKERISALDGSETICLGDTIGHPYRVCSRTGMPVIRELQKMERKFIEDDKPQRKIAVAWHQAVSKYAGWECPESKLLFFGQDLAFAAPLAKKHITVGGILEAIRQGIDSHLSAAHKHRCLDEGSTFASSHGTRYPVFQGPMARVSDLPAFACEVAKNGGLPFMAAAWMKAGELDTVLKETDTLLNGKPWGVGLLGFLPAEAYKDQIQTVIKRCPPFAIIAGGRAYQARELEQKGISTYLHVPSQGLMRMFLDDGIKRFVLEGREAGGHVGPLSSLVLWNFTIDLLLEYFESHVDPRDYHLLFAGGIYNDLSASMVAVMAAPLAERGVRIGVQLGSSYLFCREAVTTGAILQQYQKEAMRCDGTKLLVTGPGHAERCMDTPFARSFQEERLRLIKADVPGKIQYETLERFKQGRLRIASKGMVKNSDYKSNPGAPRLMELTSKEQYQRGNYMIGQLAALLSEQVSMDKLHSDVTVKASKRVDALHKLSQKSGSGRKKNPPSDVAIIGMACLLPKAHNLQTYWENILNKVDAISEVPGDRWDWRLYFDPDTKARDKCYSKWGGFLDPVPYDPLCYGITPNSLPSIEPLQLLTLETVRAALEDAGYSIRPFPREHTSVILGISGTGDLSQRYGFRSALPTYLGNSTEGILSHFKDVLPEWTEDSFAGILANVAAGRVANRFDLGGLNCSIDAACASSLAALYLGVKELENRTSDMVIVGGADTLQNPFTYLCFSKTQALSPLGKCRTLDQSADGTVLGEGIAVVILKRLADAERDGDRIYAVIKAVDAASDGRDKSLTAPRLEGQVRALQKAYTKAGFSPSTVGLIEAHGTGTVVGDQVEVQALNRVFNDQRSNQQSCAIGSVKSMIGHTKAAAGMASLVKGALALYHKVLPPTNGVEKPNSAICSSESSIYVNTEPRPWINDTSKCPRRAGVSAFGFGGTNFHTVLEEYTEDFLGFSSSSVFQKWPSELFIWKGSSRQELLEAIEPLEKAVGTENKLSLSDLAFTLAEINRQTFLSKEKSLTLAVVATSPEDLNQKIALARKLLNKSESYIVRDLRGIYFSEQPLSQDKKVAFLFPGQGSQYLNMLHDLAIQFPDVRVCFDRSDSILKNHLPKPLSSFIFPPPGFNREQKRSAQRALAQTNIAQPAMGTANLAMFHLLQDFGIRPDVVAGHSYGEYVALCAAGAITEDDLIALSEARGRFIVEAAGSSPGTMAAVHASAHTVSMALKDQRGVEIANLNAPEQTVIAGSQPAVKEAVKHLKTMGIQVQRLQVACAFHSSVVANAREDLAGFLSGMKIGVPRLKVFSNTTASAYPVEPGAICQLLIKHLVNPVKFTQEIETMYAEGARIFVEVGPGRVLTGLVNQILGSQPHLAVASNQAEHSGLARLQHLLGELAAQGVDIKMDKLYEGRSVKKIDLKTSGKRDHQDGLSKTTWLINGTRSISPREICESLPHETPAPMQVMIPDEGGTRSSGHKKEEQVHAPASDVSGTEQQAFSGKTELNSPGEINSATSSFLGNGHTKVMAGFQQMMSRFLDTQRSVMMTYLKGKSAEDNSFARLQQNRIQENSALMSTLQQDDTMPSDHGHHQTTTQKPPVEKEETQPPTVSEKNPIEADTTQTNEKQLLQQLLDIVSERTGYPSEMLDLDLDLEADLGIDSIKRVEILGAFLKRSAPSHQQETEKGMENLSEIKTLRGIIEWVEKLTRSEPDKNSQDGDTGVLKPAVSEDEDHSPDVDEVLQRFTMSPVITESDAHYSPLTAHGVIVITDDERGVAQSLINEMKNQGHTIALVRLGQEIKEIGNACYSAPFISAEGASKLIEIIRQRQGPIGGLVHLLPLKKFQSYSTIDLAGLKDRLRMEVKSFFYLIKCIEKDLKQAEQGSSCIVAATGMGGNFASNVSVTHERFFPGQGGISGLLKTVSLEWPEVRVKAVDLSLEEPVLDLAHYILAEINCGDNIVEVGYKGSQRLILEPALTPLENDGLEGLTIDSSWVILATGGARGITADVVFELARKYKPTLILLGRSPMPPEKESEDTVGLSSDRDLKAALIVRMKRQGKTPVISEIDSAYRELCKEREIRSNLAAMREAGAKVEYFQVDVRDENQFGGLIDNVYRSYGKIDGVVHGAGIIKDKLITDKTPESFDQVFGTKTESAFILSKKLHPESLKFFVLFTSVAGLFGNQGQCDYAAANEVLNKLTVYLNNTWPGRVVSINWGPWDKSGMVTPELQRQFAQRGVEMVPCHLGPKKLDQELCFGQKRHSEVILGGIGWTTKQKKINLVPARNFPMIVRNTDLVRKTEGCIEVTKKLVLSQDLFLQDHKLDGKPVLPASMAMELMAEVAVQVCPELEIVRIRDFRTLKGVVVQGSDMLIRVAAEAKGVFQQSKQMDVSISNNEDQKQLYYSATIEFGDKVPVHSIPSLVDIKATHPFQMTVQKAYRQWLFHGPTLQGIQEVKGVGIDGIRAWLTPSSPGSCFSENSKGSWLIDPVIIDCAFQLVILWSRMHRDMTSLPSFFKTYTRLAPLSGKKIECHVNVLPGSEGNIIHSNIAFLDDKGNLLGIMEGVESTCSKSLNRLTSENGLLSTDAGTV